MSTGKIFLSHSSFDKNYVKPIAEKLGKDRCVYDEICFEEGMKNLDEIIKGLDSSNIFVFFISNHSLNSEWVQREITLANEKLMNNKDMLRCIFPIIIDETVDYTDERIPDAMRRGFNSYNLRFIKSNIIAFRKIETHFLKLQFESQLEIDKTVSIFYGRNNEIKSFVNQFDGGQPIKCLVTSGIDGIGRKSFMIEALKQSKIIPSYYSPSVVSLSRNDSILDLIMKMVELGFCENSITKINNMSQEEKEACLIEALESIQLHKEHVVIYDDLCLVEKNGKIKEWFNRCIQAIRNEITISIAARAKLDGRFLQNNKSYFFIALSTLPYPEWNGLMRTYSHSLGLNLDTVDREWFKDIITGYPPQVLNCVDMINEHGLEYVKKSPNLLISNVHGKITSILEKAFDGPKKNLSFSFLSFLSEYGTLPMSTVSDILKFDTDYIEILKTLISLTLVRLTGSTNDCIEVNPIVCDYMQRSNFEMPDNLKYYLREKLEEFNNELDANIDAYEFESVKYYLQQNIIQGKSVPNKFLYSTLFLNSIRTLYDRDQYKSVIDLVANLKENGAFSRFDGIVKDKMQRYYCLALARETDKRFYEQVELFRGSKDIEKNINEYNFLRGFMFRQNGEYDKALDRFSQLLKTYPNHRAALREIVSVYRALEDFDSFRDLARENYINEPENPYHIQPYLESLIFQNSLNESEVKDIEKIMTTITNLQSQKPFVAYYEMQSMYALHIENDKEKALNMLEQGLEKFPKSSYIHKALFDLHCHNKNIDGMKESLDKLREFANNNRLAQIMFKMREALFYAHQKKSLPMISIHIDRIQGMTPEARYKLMQKVNLILNENETSIKI